MIHKVFKYLKKPKMLILILMTTNLTNFMPDELFLKIKYRITFGKKLNLNNPKNFNEKMQWLKLNDHKEIYTSMVDKYEVKKHVSNIIGEEYIIPSLGVYNSFDDINFDKLPSKFVIKCTHDSGGLVIVKDKNNFRKKEAKNRLNKFLKRNYFYSGREWPYKNVKPKILIEKYIENNNEELIDYKFFCFNGKPQIILVCSERFSSDNMCETWFDTEWNLLDIVESNHRIDTNVPKPINFEKMKEYSHKLSRNIPFLRVDFYEVNGQIYFGELTFYPSSGFAKFEPSDWNLKLGEMLDISKVRKNEK